MQILLPQRIIRRLQREMRNSGRIEIGGLLMGEHLHDETFRVVDLSVQRMGGTEAEFIRQPNEHKNEIQIFFKKTGHDYTRFNYLGEWHSHPTTEPIPSSLDIQTMKSIVNDPKVGVNFLILLITKPGKRNSIELTATLFRARSIPCFVPISIEKEQILNPLISIFRWMHRFFKK